MLDQKRFFPISINGNRVGYVIITQEVVDQMEAGVEFDFLGRYMLPSRSLVEIGLAPKADVAKTG